MEELVDRAKNNDSDAFTHLILNIERDLYCIAKNEINNENDIEDIIQETMIIAYLNIRKLKNNSFFIFVKFYPNKAFSSTLLSFLHDIMYPYSLFDQNKANHTFYHIHQLTAKV